MNKTDILKAINEVVADYMVKGYMVDFGDSSFGYDFRVDMVKQGEAPIRICAQRAYESQPLFMDTLKIVVLYTDNGWEKKGVEPIFVRTFYKISETWFTENLDAAIAAYKVKYERYGYERNKRRIVEITPTENFLRIIRRRRNFEDATLQKLKISRNHDRYTVTLLNRVGNVKAEYTCRLGGKRT